MGPLFDASPHPSFLGDRYSAFSLQSQATPPPSIKDRRKVQSNQCFFSARLSIALQFQALS
jgi:hypothetical protein